MMMFSRRSFAAAVVGASTLSGKPDSKVKGVIVGLQSYSFRDRGLDETIQAMSSIGLSYVELWAGHLQPRNAKPDDLKKWRTDPATLERMREVRRKFNRAGIRVYALSYSFRRSHSDEEILHGMDMAKALGSRYLTASTTVDQARRINDLAGRKGVLVALHNHANIRDSNELATPDSFGRALASNPNLRINLDVGHMVAANYDPVEFLRNYYPSVLCLHLKDRKRNQGVNVPFGHGDVPLRQIVQLLRSNRWQIPAMIEYEYAGNDAVEEVRRSYDFLRRALL